MPPEFYLMSLHNKLSPELWGKRVRSYLEQFSALLDQISQYPQGDDTCHETRRCVVEPTSTQCISTTTRNGPRSHDAETKVQKALTTC